MTLNDVEKMHILKGLISRQREIMDWYHHPSPKPTNSKAKAEQELADLRALVAKVAAALPA